ncbi:MAG: low molecular weight protein-tyrosine-phosphatase [Betaproteobacteria bacterium]
MIRILLVCTGNICRSPLAEVAVRKQLSEAGLDAAVVVESAGTQGSHAGEAPDPRAVTVAAARGYDFSEKTARKIVAEDFDRFDWILAMDRANLSSLRRICPDEKRHKLALFLAFAGINADGVVIDPYFGNLEGFENTLDACEAAATALIDRIKSSGALGNGDATPV